MAVPEVFSKEFRMHLKTTSAIFALACLGMLLSDSTSLTKADRFLPSPAVSLPSVASTHVAGVTSCVALNRVIKKTKLMVTQGNDGSAFASAYEKGDVITLKHWENGETTLDGSGNTNMRVDVLTGGPILYHLDPAYGDPIYAIDWQKLGDVLREIFSFLLF